MKAYPWGLGPTANVFFVANNCEEGGLQVSLSRIADRFKAQDLSYKDHI